MNSQQILDLMGDHVPRTSYEVCAILDGSNPRKWFKISAMMDKMTEKHQLVSLGKNDKSQSVYQRVK